MDNEILNEKKRNREEKPEALASPENVSKKKKKKKRKMNENDAETEQQNQQPSQVCPKPLVVATPISVEETPKKKKMEKKKSNLIGEQHELNKKEEEEETGELPNETNALAIEGQNQYPEPLVVPISVEANLVDPKDTPKKKKKKRGQKKNKKNKNKSDLNGEQQELNKEELPNETNPPKPSLAFEVPTDLEMKTETLDRDKSQTEPHAPTSTLQLTIPIETEQNLSKRQKKRKNKKRRVVLDDGVQPNEYNIETPVQSQMSICHTPMPTTNHTMDSHPVIPICPKQCSPIEQTIAVDPAISMDEPAPQIGQTIPMNRNQRKRMNKKKKMLDGAHPNGPNIEQPETLVQSQTAILMNNRKQRWMAKKSLLSGEQPNGYIMNELETPVQKSISPIEGSESNGHNANSTAEAPVRETIGVTVTKDPSNWHDQRSQMCWACRKSDHKISQCRMLKSLSKHAEVCFFCGEIGHSLRRCSVSSAGGGRLAKCLLCHADGHFSFNCPGDGHGNYLKVVAANGPINRTLKAFHRCLMALELRAHPVCINNDQREPEGEFVAVADVKNL